jgi:hypothetical protein
MTNIKIAKSFVFQVGKQMTQEYISTTLRDREYWHLIPALHSLRACIYFLHKLVSFEIGMDCSTKEGNPN